MKKIISGCLLIISMLCPHHIAAQHLNPSNIRISLLTAAPGEELYSAWGHNGVRVKIDSLDYDVVYNYGTFDFNQPNFYSNFARGLMLYRLSRTSYDNFIAEYMYENRCVREQVFALDSAQTISVALFLENNYLPENRNYRYHFLLDNCATRIRDLMLQTFDGIELPQSESAPTYRDLIHLYLKDHPWGRFGIDIALGLPTDQKTDAFEQMFLPDYMFHTFARMLYHGQPIVQETKDIFVPAQPAILPPGPITPTVVCVIVSVLALVLSFKYKGFGLRCKVFAKIFDFALFFSVGLVGLLVTFLWFFTDHTTTQNNLNIIWALPTHLVMAFFLFSKRRSNFTRYYFLAIAILAMLLLVSWGFLPQRLNPSLIPLVIAIELRAFSIFRRKLIF